MKQQLAITHKICQIEISEFLDRLRTHLSEYYIHKKLQVLIFLEKHDA